jgi:curved DNA-binding protein CbpA
MIDKIKEALEFMDIPPLSSIKDIKRQYKKLSKKYHPDKQGDDKMMHKLNESYGVLVVYCENYKFTFDESEIKKQHPDNFYKNNFRF